MKVSQQRWYVIGPSDIHPDDPHIYALDRIISMEPTHERFTYPADFNPEEFFTYNYGIFHSSEKPLTIRIKVSKWQRKYTDSLPLHWSQTTVEATDDYTVYEYRLCPDHDFIQEIAGKGPDYEVLEPAEFRSRVADYITAAAKLYMKK